MRFEFEHPLIAEPLRIDVIIKKTSSARLEKNIARHFRTWNIIEYKSPEDSLSIKDFHKVLSYTHLYLSQNKVDIQELTTSIVVARYPQRVIRYIRETIGWSVREAESGIYAIEGGMIPLQIIITKQLKEGENIWLKHLSNDLNVESMSQVMKASREPWKNGYIRAYMYMLFQANGKALREVMKMRSNVLEKILEEEGWTARWEKRGETRGRKIGEAEGRKIGSMKGKEERSIEIAKKLLTKGWKTEDIAEVTELDVKKVKQLSKAE